VIATVASVTALTSRGQSRRSKTEPPPLTIAASTTSSNAFSAAAAQNAILRNEVTWTFGGKQQRGWYLYDLLIGKTLDTSHDPITNEFAATLAKWQKKRGLRSDGLLDEASLMKLVSHWQSDRLKSRNPATPDQLVLAPTTDFYDPGRATELRQVERNTYEAYKQMIAAAHADPTVNLKASDKYLKIISAFRSPEYQEQLRRQSPNAGRAGLAVVDTKDSNRAIQVNTPAYRWLVRNAERFGFRPYFYEPWHWEYVK
jgi:LAS superfamily LD-carboxypeptidase LdcB